MPIHIIWGNDLNAQNTFIQKLIEKEVSPAWSEINVTNLNGDDEEQINQAMEEILSPPFGEGSRLVILKNNPIFTTKNEEIRIKLEKNYDNIPENTFFILQSAKKPDSRLKSTKFVQQLIKEDLAQENSFSLPEIWDFEGQKRYLKEAANDMNIEIEEDAAELIIDSVGNDSFRLRNELAKAKTFLSAYSNNSASRHFLKSVDVKKIFTDNQSNIFKIIDLLLQKNINESLLEIRYLLQKGEPALRLNAGLISQVRIHTIVKLSINSKSGNIDNICNLANISNPKRVFFIRKKVQNVSQEYLINLMGNLLIIESLLKRGNNPISVFTDNLTKTT